MAKKKKKTIEIKLLLKVLALVLGVGAVLFGLLKSVAFSGKLVDASFTGFQSMFGYTEETVLGDVEHLKFSFMVLLSFILPLVGGVLILPKNKILNFVAIACFVVGAVLLFLLPSLVVLPENSVYLAETVVRSLAVGAILSAICSILGGLVSAYITFTK